MALSFVDAGGLNPLPAGIVCALTNSLGAAAGTSILQAGGVFPLAIGAGVYTATFTGTQAPTAAVSFVSPGPNVTVVVPNYQSPVYSVQGYAAEAAAHLTKGWFVDPAGSTTYPSGIGANTYALLLGLAQAVALEDANLQQTLGALRLQSATGSAIDSFALDFFGSTFYRLGESDALWIYRIEQIFATQKCTVAGLQAIINVFWPYILPQLISVNLAEDIAGGEDSAAGGGEDYTNAALSGAGVPGQAMGSDTFGGEDTGTTFEDAPAPTQLPPVPVVFDEISNPTLAGYLSLTHPNFCVYVQYPGYADSLIHSVGAAQSAILAALVAAWKATGTTAVYAQNR